MPAHFSISRTSKNPIVFGGLGCAKNAGSGPGVEFQSWRLSLSAPSNAWSWLEQQPGVLEQGVGDTTFPPCIVSCCRGEMNVKLWGEQKLSTDFFFSVIWSFFLSTFPYLSCLPSESWVSNTGSVLQLCPENHLRSVKNAAPTCASLWLLHLA